MSVHRMPPRDEPFDPRLAALAHAGMAEEIGGRHDPGPMTAGQAGELASAVACGLVYVGDQVKAATERRSTSQLVLPTPEAVATWRGLDPQEGYREFLRDQAAQIPEGIERAVRELLSQLEGQSLEFELREPVQSLTDWLNQLGNVRREVADGGAGE